MAATLAQTTFQTGADDSLAAVDVYKQSSADVPVDDSGSTASDPTDVASFMGLDSAMDAAPDVFDADAGSALASTDISQGLIAQTPDLQSFYSQVDSDLKKQLTDTTGQFANLQMTDTTLPGALPTATNLASAKNVVNVSGMLNVIAGNGKIGISVKDVAAQTTFLSNLVKVSANLNIPNAYAKIDAGNFGAAVMGPVTQAALKVAVSTSNVNLLANIANGSMSGSVKAMFPGFPAAFSANFKFQPGHKPSFNAQLGLNIQTAFGKIDANWANTNGKTRTSLNANLFVNASPAFKAVMSASATYSKGAFAMKAGVSTAGLAISAIPAQASLSANVRTKSGISVAGNLTQTFMWPNGSSHVYETLPDQTVTKTVYDPDLFPTDPVAIAGLDTSPIHDPLAQASAFGECMRQGAADSTTINPMMNASDSLASNFPLANFGQLTDLPTA